MTLAREVLPRDLWSDFERSLGTPQLGPYHYEGPFMGSPGSHLELVLAALEAVGRGEFHPDVPEGVRPLMRKEAEEYAEIVPVYVLLHDIDKINCLTFVYTDGRKVPVPHADWERILAADPEGPAIRALDGEALRRFCERHGIRQISYYQNTAGGFRTHGRVTARRLHMRGDLHRMVVSAIETHEIAFQFQARGGLNLPLLAKAFGPGHLVLENLHFPLLVNYADQMGSLGTDGQPSIQPFVALARTFLSVPKFWEIERRVKDETEQLNGRALGRRETLFIALWKSQTLLETESADDSVRRIVADCTATSRG